MANITRTVFTAKARAFYIDGIGNDGKPVVKQTEEVRFTSTAPNKREAFRALKAAGIKCSKDMTTFEVESEQVYCMDLDTFLAHAVPVTRKRNGEVKENEPTAE